MSITRTKTSPQFILGRSYTCRRVLRKAPYTETFYNNLAAAGTSIPYSSLHTITYDSGPKSTLLVIDGQQRNVPKFKSCTHRETDMWFEPGLGVYDSKLDATYFYECTYPVKFWFDFFDFENNLITHGFNYMKTSTLASSVSSAAALAVKQGILSDDKLLGFPQAFSVLNFIAELKDVKRFPELVRKWTRSSKDVSDKFLGVNFGVLPFASDITAITARLKNLGPNIDRWNRDADDVRVLNGHVDFTPDGSFTNQTGYIGKTKQGHQFYFDLPANRTYAFGYDSKLSGTIRYELHRTIKCVAHAYYVPIRLPSDLSDDIKREVWGFSKPLTAIWNAIPFSFVVDWFTNVGDLIHAFENKAPLLKVKLLSAGYSIKIDTRIVMRVGVNGDSSMGVYSYSDKYYQRIPLSPTAIFEAGRSYGSLQFNLIDSSQALLGSALLHQRLR